jgi:glycosyltransferase involved in cell wall biosynthesis
MTTYNSELFLTKTIKSLLSQTFKDFRLIISDDASTDSTEIICKKFASEDPRVEFIKQEVNIGPLANFSFVLNAAHSEYFMWASHDDLWHPLFIEKCLDGLNNHVDAGFVVTRWIVESMKIPFLRRMNLADMSFVSHADPIHRMLSFTALPFHSFKDNITYGVWRHEVLLKIINDLHGKLKYFSIGAAANEYCLLKYKGVLLNDVYLRKRYRWIPPGHILRKLVASFQRVIFNKCVGSESLNCKYSAQDHIDDLQTVLELCRCDKAVIDNALDKNRIWLKEHENFS